jgi:hypothetical protein
MLDRLHKLHGGTRQERRSMPTPVRGYLVVKIAITALGTRLTGCLSESFLK